MQTGATSLVDLHTPVCNNSHMATNRTANDNLVEEARRVGHHKTKKDAVTAALAECGAGCPSIRSANLNHTLLRVPHSSAFFAEGWEAIN